MDTCVVYKNMHTYRTGQNFDEEKINADRFDV